MTDLRVQPACWCSQKSSSLASLPPTDWVDTSVSVPSSALRSTAPWMESVASSVMAPSSLVYFLMNVSSAGKKSLMYMVTSLSAYCVIYFSSSTW